MTLRLSLKEIAYSEYRFLRKKVFRRYLVWIMSALILFYQRKISKHTCLYSPTCSQYMLESLNRFGAVVGLIMGCWRILRCNPLSKGGYDPVPEKFWHYVWLK